jgi:hypothetical protein
MVETTTLGANPVGTAVVEYQEEARLLESFVKTEGWEKLVKPALLNLRNTYNLALIDGKITAASGTEISIEQCRAIIKTMDWVLSWEDKLNAVAKELQQAVSVLAASEGFSGGSPLAKQPE